MTECQNTPISDAHIESYDPSKVRDTALRFGMSNDAVKRARVIDLMEFLKERQKAQISEMKSDKNEAANEAGNERVCTDKQNLDNVGTRSVTPNNSKVKSLYDLPKSLQPTPSIPEKLSSAFKSQVNPVRNPLANVVHSAVPHITHGMEWRPKDDFLNSLPDTSTHEPENVNASLRPYLIKDRISSSRESTSPIGTSKAWDEMRNDATQLASAKSCMDEAISFEKANIDHLDPYEREMIRSRIEGAVVHYERMHLKVKQDVENMQVRLHRKRTLLSIVTNGGTQCHNDVPADYVRRLTTEVSELMRALDQL